MIQNKEYWKEVNLAALYKKYNFSDFLSSNTSTNANKLIAVNYKTANNIVFCDGILIFLGDNILASCHTRLDVNNNISKLNLFVFNDKAKNINIMYIHTNVCDFKKLNYVLDITLDKYISVEFKEEYIGISASININTTMYLNTGAKASYNILSQNLHSNEKHMGTIITHNLIVNMDAHVHLQIYVGTVLCILHSFIINIRMLGEHSCFIFKGVSCLISNNINHRIIDVEHMSSYTSSEIAMQGCTYENSKLVVNSYGSSILDLQNIILKQKLKGILMDSNSAIYFTPILMIASGATQAMHGASISEINEKLLFFLQTKCLNFKEAKRIVVISFLASILKEEIYLGEKRFFEFLLNAF